MNKDLIPKGRKGKLPGKLQLSSVLHKRDMFLREVKTLQKLQSSGVVPQIYYAGLKKILICNGAYGLYTLFIIKT